jgi:hypothetical protein
VTTYRKRTSVTLRGRWLLATFRGRMDPVAFLWKISTRSENDRLIVITHLPLGKRLALPSFESGALTNGNAYDDKRESCKDCNVGKLEN